jgi:hypothetical protein
MRASAPQRFFVPPIDRSGPTAAASQTLTPSLFDESTDTFFTPVVTSRFTLLPALYTDLDTFFTPVVKGRNTLTPSLYVDADTFFVPVVTAKKTLVPGLFVDSDTFFNPIVKGLNTLNAGLYTDADTFYTPVVSQPGLGSQTLLPSLYVDSDSFFTPTVLGRTTLTPSIFTDLDIFFTPSVSGGDTPTVEIFQGGGKQYRYEKVKNSSDVDSVMHSGDVLTIRYKDGKVYNYQDVPEKKFDRLTHSRSPGSYVHNNIKEKYVYRKVR